GGHRADGALALRVAHLRGLAAVVLGARLCRLQAGGELERGAREDARLRHGGGGARRPRAGGGARAPPACAAHRPAPASALLARAAARVMATRDERGRSFDLRVQSGYPLDRGGLWARGCHRAPGSPAHLGLLVLLASILGGGSRAGAAPPTEVVFRRFADAVVQSRVTEKGP